MTDYLLSFWKTLFNLRNGHFKFLCCGILDFLTAVLETSYLACMGFEMVLARPWFSTFKTLALGACLADVHWNSSLSSEGSRLVRVDFYFWCQERECRCGHFRPLSEPCLFEGCVTSMVFAIGDLHENCFCTGQSHFPFR